MSVSEQVLTYWFGESDDPATVFSQQASKWFRGGEAVDDEIRKLFMDDIRAAIEGDRDDWLDEPRSCMALVVLLDQFTRNVFRNTPRAFAGDGEALAAAEHAIQHGYEAKLAFHHRIFLYVPFEHSESLAVQNRGVEYFEKLVAEGGPYVERAKAYLQYAVQHRDIIARFARFPHRNETLGRPSTEEETEFLKQPGSSF